MSKAILTDTKLRALKATDKTYKVRGMASTLLNERDFNRDWIEIQLAHSPRDAVRSAYNHAGFLEKRRGMMQWWADFLYEQGGEGR